MSLASLWKSQKGELATKHIQAMIGLAGDGNGSHKNGARLCATHPPQVLAHSRQHSQAALRRGQRIKFGLRALVGSDRNESPSP